MSLQKEDRAPKPSLTKKEIAYRLLVKWPRRILMFLFLLTVLTYVLLQLPVVQDYIKNKTVAYLEKDLKTEVQVKDVNISIISGFSLNEFLLKDRNKDTLLYASTLNVRLTRGLLSLMNQSLHVNTVKLSGAQIRLNRAPGESHFNGRFVLDYLTPKKQREKKFHLDLKALDMSDVVFQLSDHVKESYLDVSLPSASIIVDSIDLAKNRFVIDEVKIQGIDVAMMTRPVTDSLFPIAKPKTKTDSMPLFVLVQSFKIKDGLFANNNYRKRDSLHGRQSIDFAHLQLSDIDAFVRGFEFKDQQFSGSIPKISLREKSGFVLSHFSAKKASISQEETALTGFSIETPNSQFGQSIALSYDGFSDFDEFVDNVLINATLKESKIGVKDVLYFAEKLNSNRFFLANMDRHISLQGRLMGLVNNLRAQDMILSLGDSFISGDFKVRDITDSELTSVYLNISDLVTDMPTLRMLIPDFSPPAMYNRLGRMRFNGRFDGFYRDFVAFGHLKTALGQVNGDMNLNINDGLEKAQYSGELSLNSFDLGQWFDNPDIGRISLVSEVTEGSGLTLNTATGILKGQIQEVVFKQYPYKDVHLNGQLEKNLFDGQLSVKDHNIDFDFNGSVDFTDSIAQYRFNADIRQFNLHQVNLTKKPLIVKGQVDIDVEGRNLASLSGKSKLKDIQLINSTDSFELDAATITADLSQNDNRFLNLESPLLNAELSGSFEFAHIFDALKQTLIQKSPRFASKLNIKTKRDSISAQDFYAKIQLPHSQNITQLLHTGIDSITDLTIEGRYNNRGDSIALAINIGGLFSGNKAVRNAILDVTGKPGLLKLHANIFETDLNEKKSLPPISSTISLFPDTLDFKLKTSNLSSVLKNIRFNGYLLPEDNFYELVFKSSNLMLVEEVWKIDSDNYFRFGPDYLDAQNIYFIAGEKEIQLTTPTASSLKLNLRNFDFAFVNPLINYENLPFSGPFESEIFLQDIKSRSGLSANLVAPEVKIHDEIYGHLSLNATMKDLESPIDVKLELDKENRHLKTVGHINPHNQPKRNIPAKTLHLNGEIKNYPFDIMEYIVPKGISETAGNFDGNITVSGPLNGPEFDGEAHILDGEVTIDYLKTHYYINRQKIKFKTNGINGTGAILKDKYGNSALIYGGLTHRRFKNFGLDVRISSDNFLLLDTEKGDNEVYYGHILGEAYVEFMGSFDTPELKIIGKTNDGSTLILPFTDEKSVDKNSFVQFVSFKEQEAIKQDLQSTGLNIQMQVDLTEDTDIKIIFDEQSGDIIESTGSGPFTMSYHRSGEFKINGQYTISKGEYLFTLLGFINKPFLIDPGGTITWTGDPYKAKINLTAKYQGLTASVYSLIQSDLLAFDSSNDEIKQAKRPTPINLDLFLSGDLFAPDIAFGLDVQNLYGSVKNLTDSRLSVIKSNPGELNRQVFGLLMFGSFLPSGTGASGLTGNDDNLVTITAVNTLSEFLSSQFSLYVNSLLSEIVGYGKIYSGMELDVALNIYQEDFQGASSTLSDYSREFRVSMKNYFFNNRVSVQIGGAIDYGIQNTSELAHDVVVEVILSKNRRVSLQVYNKSEPSLLGDRRNKSGFGIRYNREFDSLKEFFQAKGKE